MTETHSDLSPDLPSVVLCGEAWGRSEANYQHPLVGASGRELTLQLGSSGLCPYMQLLCRKCKYETDFTNGHCARCGEYCWPTELSLIHHWKTLRDRHNIYVTNVFNEHPPEICNNCGSRNISLFGKMTCNECNSRDVRSNDLGHFFSTERQTEMPPWKASQNTRGTHVKEIYFRTHIRRLWRELDELNPSLVIAMGNAACWALLGQTKISVLRGTISRTNQALTSLDFKVLPVFHPAAILRNMKLRTTTIADYQKAARERTFRETRRPERLITVPHPSASGLDEIRTWIRANRFRRLASDIETIRGTISIVGFSPDSFSSLVVPFRDAHTKDGRIIDVGKIARSLGIADGGINFWPTAELETLAWKLIREIQEGPSEKIFQNGLYDISHLMKMGIQVRNARHDTMLWHHSRYPELPKSLGYLGSLYSNDIAWKQMTRSENLKRDE